MLYLRKLESFNSVQFRGPGILTIVQDEEESLEINAPGYMLNEIQSTVVKEELLVGYVASSIVSLSAHREKIQYRLNIRNLKQLFVKGSGDVVLPDLDNDQFSIVVTGSGVTKVDQLTADRLDVSISGDVLKLAAMLNRKQSNCQVLAVILLKSWLAILQTSSCRVLAKLKSPQVTNCRQ